MEYDTTILFEEHAHAYLSVIQIIEKVLQCFHYLFSLRDFEGAIVRTCKDHCLLASFWVFKGILVIVGVKRVFK